MVQVNGWYFNGVSPIPKDAKKPEWEGKELYEYRKSHEVHGVMWITVIASNGKEAERMIADVTK